MPSLIKLMQDKIADQERELGLDHPSVIASKRRLAAMETPSDGQQRFNLQAVRSGPTDPAEAVLDWADSQREARNSSWGFTAPDSKRQP